MVFQEGYLYYLKDSFFNLIGDSHFMTNKENQHYRPHFYAFSDKLNPHILWMVPVSSRYEKYESLYKKQVHKYGRCTKIVLGNCDGRPAAFLIQNAFPTLPHYLDHIHTNKGEPLTLHHKTQVSIIKSLNYNLKLHRRGIKIFFTNIDSIYHSLEKELKCHTQKQK